MEAKARFLGHAVHPMLVVFPLGLLAFVPVFDIVQIVTNGTLWAQMAFWLTVCGLFGALAGAIFGVIDLVWTVRGAPARIASG